VLYVFRNLLVLRLNGEDNLNPKDTHTNQVCVLVGSNIDPIRNCRLAIQELSRNVKIIKSSSIWETEAIGENFLNFALLFQTKFDLELLKTTILKPLEEKLGRVRSANKNAPRTMDLDVVLFNSIVIDEKMWEQYFIALPLSELFPQMVEVKSGKSLREIARELTAGKTAVCRKELTDTLFNDILKM
jgi:2-amino-4-hydroxy-6-hydroxymethyldihydropteridine diphosphokinase